MRKWKLAPRTVSLLIVLGVFFCALVMRRLGWLQFLEFRAYDALVQRQPKLATGDPIVLVLMTEDDIKSESLDYPLTDQKLAELLRILLKQEPAVIGLDLWRDQPVPKDKAHLQELNEVLLAHTNIVAIYTLAGIPPPAALAPYPDRLGYNDNFPIDEHVERTTPKVRRSMLFSKAESGQRLNSFPFGVARVFLAQHGIEAQIDTSAPATLRLGKAELHPLEPNDGPYVGADTSSDEGMQILLDFQAPHDFVRYSVGEVLAGQLPTNQLRNKIVMLGMNAFSVMDERVTPLDPRQPGIEVQSLTILQLLRSALDGQPERRFWYDWQEDAWMLLWGLIGGIIGYRVRSPWRFTGAIVLALLGLCAITWQAWEAGWWIPVTSPAVAFLPAVTLVTSFISFQEHRQRGQLMQLFANQVSPDIAEALWAQREEFLAGNRPRSQKLMATTLFTDLKGFSTTSEGLEPGDLMDWLNEYMEVMAKEVMAHQGVVEKYIGDSVMAVFGVPIPRATPEQISQDARNAVRCALAMAKRMVQLNAVWKERGLPECSMRIGIHTGVLVAGSLGSVERQEYTVIGDSVNTASRLESFDKESVDPKLQYENCRILISEATKVMLNENFTTVSVGSISLKGKSDSIMVHRVIADQSN